MSIHYSEYERAEAIKKKLGKLLGGTIPLDSSQCWVYKKPNINENQKERDANELLY